MQTITIELINDKALILLQQLEQLNILRLLNNEEEKTVKPKPTWAGSISKETGKKLLHYVKESRQEWERNI